MDLGVLAAGVYQVRFAETDNEGYFTMGVDNVSVQAVPEPSAFLCLGAGLGSAGFRRASLQRPLRRPCGEAFR